MNKKANDSETTGVDQDRRGPNRTREDADWESKVLGRVGGHVRELSKDDTGTNELGWEASALDVLRRRIERTPK